MGKAAKVNRFVVILRSGRQRRLNARHGGVDGLQRLEHVHIPVEKQIDFRGAAAGQRSHVVEPGNRVHSFFDLPGHHHFHLIDRHHSVIDANHDTRKVRRGKYGDRYRERQIGSERNQGHNDEHDRAQVSGRPVLGLILIQFRCLNAGRFAHFSPASGFFLVARFRLRNLDFGLVFQSQTAHRNDLFPFLHPA